MPSVVQSCRIENKCAALLAKQAKRRNVNVCALSSLYLAVRIEEEEFPGVGFRDSAGGRETCVRGHRVAVWEAVDVHRAVRTVAKTAEHFQWPPALVRSALAYAKAYPKEVRQQRDREVAT